MWKVSKKLNYCKLWKLKVICTKVCFTEIQKKGLCLASWKGLQTKYRRVALLHEGFQATGGVCAVFWRWELSVWLKGRVHRKRGKRQGRNLRTPNCLYSFICGTSVSQPFLPRGWPPHLCICSCTWVCNGWETLGWDETVGEKSLESSRKTFEKQLKI